MTQSEAIPAALGLFVETSEGPRLVGSRCQTCATAAFPKSELCPNPECTESAMQPAHFGPRGQLFSLTIQAYSPPPPVIIDEPFCPYAVGLIDLENEDLRVIGRLLVDDPEKVEVGCTVELILAPLGLDGEGREIISWQFQPV